MAFYVYIYDWKTTFTSQKEETRLYTFGPMWSQEFASNKMRTEIEDYEEILSRDGEYYLKYVKNNEVIYDFGYYGRRFVIREEGDSLCYITDDDLLDL